MVVGCNRQDRHRRICSAGQYHCHPVTPSYTEVPQHTNRTFGLLPEGAVRDRSASWREDGMAVWRRSPIEGNEITDAGKDAN